jgi:hypothetical protein
MPTLASPRTTRRLAATILAAAVMLLAATACQPAAPARAYWCDPSDTAINDGHGGTLFNAAYTKPKGPLTTIDCLALTNQLNSARDWVESVAPTVSAAESAGFVQAAVWQSGQGYHYVDPSRTSGPLDLTRPNWLMFDGTGPSARVVGMMYLVSSGSSPPVGFPGSNDHWHQHHQLCVTRAYPIFIGGDHMTDAECQAIGGTNQMFSDTWMVHVWLPRYDSWLPTDIFNKSHPNIP